MADNEKVAIVTGAARGIGKEIVRELLAVGMTVIAADIQEDLLAKLPAEFNAGEKFEFRKLDVTDGEAFTAVVDEIAEKFGRLDVLVNNAGITRDGLIMRMEESDWDLVMAVNLKSAFLGTKAASRHMIRKKSGSIINMASYSGIEGNRGQANYAASKAGLLGLTKTTAKEFATKNIRCNAIAPGFIQTEMTDVLPQQAKDMALAQIPLKRFGQPVDIAKAVGFLASDASGYITGQVLSVDGGMHT